ncbi:MAG: nickel-dependent lactate racemase [Solirubrobacterales bacterium]
MDFTWKYGKEKVSFSVPDAAVDAVLKRNESASPASETEIISRAFQNPIGSPRLVEIARNTKPKRVVIVINDITRPTPYNLLLPAILGELHEAGVTPEQITLLIATGIHRPQTKEENQQLYGSDIEEKYTILNHDPDGDCVTIGTLPGGGELAVNRLAVEADLLITTGLVGLHYFAGYSGGRKSIVPGIASRGTITASHAMMSDPRACQGNITDNPVHETILAAARTTGVDFIANIVTDEKKQIVAAAAGALEEAWLAAVNICRELSVVPLKQPADLVIAGCGGFPKDINLYQAQKALDAAAPACREGGIILLAAACPEGLGEDTFEDWVMAAKTTQDIRDRFDTAFELGGHKAYAIVKVVEAKRVWLYSQMNEKLVRHCFMTPVNDLQAAIDQALKELGPAARAVIMPEAAAIAVQLQK